MDGLEVGEVANESQNLPVLLENCNKEIADFAYRISETFFLTVPDRCLRKKMPMSSPSYVDAHLIGCDPLADRSEHQVLFLINF
jgi:hypothetical protein